MGLLKFLGHIVFILVLTAVTQVGGIIWLLAVIYFISNKKGKAHRFPFALPVIQLGNHSTSSISFWLRKITMV